MPRPLSRPHRDDVLIALAGLTGGVVLWALGLAPAFGTGGPPGALALLPLTVMSGLALLRRTGQPWVLFAATATIAADVAIGSLLATVLLFTDVVYAAVVYGSPRVARRVPPVSVLASIALTLTALGFSRDPASLFLGVISALISTGPAYTGAIVRNHRDQAAAERLRAEQTALLAEMDRVQAVNAERARMARELHDMVANHLSAIAIHSTAALSLPGNSQGDGTATRDALRVIRENSVQGLSEMRRLIGILRDAEGSERTAEPDVSPTLAGLDALLARARATAEREFAFTLEDTRGAGPLPAPVELAAYRVVQEAVTNALKHAAPGTVAVGLQRTGDGRGPLTVRVTSPLDGGHRVHGPRAPGAGAGLVGMRERVDLLGGTLTAGPAEDGPAEGRNGEGGSGGTLWEVRATLPVDGEEAR